jgi:hypothetical protein
MKKTYGLQQETRTYLRRLYAYGRELRGEDINDIDEFIKGLKQLNMGKNYIGWLLKSRYNMGTGSSVVPLGLLNNASPIGTLVNSPTWGDTGITFSADNHRVFTNLSFMGNNPFPRSWSVFGITNWIGPNTESVHHLCGARSNTAGTAPWQTNERNAAENISSSFTASPEPSQVRVAGWKTICGLFDNVNINQARQGVNNGTGTIDNRIASASQPSLRWDNFHIGGGGPYNITTRAYKGIVSMIIIVDKYFTQTDYNNLRLLCKATIGKDLGIF